MCSSIKMNVLQLKALQVVVVWLRLSCSSSQGSHRGKERMEEAAPERNTET